MPMPAHTLLRSWARPPTARPRRRHCRRLKPPPATAPQATTKKVARQIAAAAILESLLESTPLEAFFASMHSSSTGSGAGKGRLEHDLAVGLYGPDTAAGSAELLQALAQYPKCQQMLLSGAAAGAALCTPAMTLFRYAQRVSSRRRLSLGRLGSAWLVLLEPFSLL